MMPVFYPSPLRWRSASCDTTGTFLVVRDAVSRRWVLYAFSLALSVLNAPPGFPVGWFRTRAGARLWAATKGQGPTSPPSPIFGVPAVAASLPYIGAGYDESLVSP
jgi:hypothetical protein